MPVQFFGQYLIDHGEIDASQVREALDLMEDENATIGEIAVARGYLTARDAIRVSAEQRTCDRSFGELAVDLGLLSRQQLEGVVQDQQAKRLPMGEALVRLGHLEPDRLATLLDAFKADQSQYEIGAMEVPAALADRPAVPHVIELLPRFLMRVARLPARVGEIRPFTATTDFDEIRVSIPLRGDRGLVVALLADMTFAEGLAIAASGLAPGDLDPEMVADGVGEFLNVVAGNAAAAVTRTGGCVELGPPDYEAELAEGFLVELAVGCGRAALLLSPD
jgi:hypothetical protein